MMRACAPRAGLQEAAADAAEHRRLPAARIAEDEQVRLFGEVDPHGGQFGLVDAERHEQPPFPGRAAAGGPPVAEGGQDVGAIDEVGQHPDDRGGATRCGRGDGGHGVRQSRGEIDGLGAAVDPRQRGQYVQPVTVDAPARPALGYRRRLLTAVLGVGGITEAQLETGPEVVPHRRSHVTPARRGEHHVDAEGQPLGGQHRDLRLQGLEVLPDAGPAVDHEEHVAEGVHVRTRPAAGPATAQLGHRFEAEFAESALPAPQQGGQLGDRPADAVGVQPVGDRADVREAGEAGQRPAAEVQTVELHLFGRVRHRHRQDEAAEHRRLAGARSSDDDHVAGRAGEVHHQRIPPLLEGAVHDADRRAQDAPRQHVTGQQRPGKEPVQARRRIERRQPDLVRGCAVAADLRDEDIEHGAAFLGREGIVAGLDRLGNGFGLRQGHFRGGEQPRPGGCSAVPGHRPVRAATLVGPRHVGGSEPHDLRRVALEVSGSRRGRQVVGVGDAENTSGFVGREGFQSNAVRQMTVESA